MKARVAFGLTPIKDIAVQCPSCELWFSGYDIAKSSLDYAPDINYAEFECPLCGQEFGGIQNGSDIEIEEYKTSRAIYRGCYKKKEVWVVDE